MIKNWKDLVKKLITMNGDGKKELEKLIEAGEITEEEAVFVQLKANTARLLDKVEEVSATNSV